MKNKNILVFLIFCVFFSDLFIGVAVWAQSGGLDQAFDKPVSIIQQVTNVLMKVAAGVAALAFVVVGLIQIATQRWENDKLWAILGGCVLVGISSGVAAFLTNF